MGLFGCLPHLCDPESAGGGRRGSLTPRFSAVFRIAGVKRAGCPLPGSGVSPEDVFPPFLERKGPGDGSLAFEGKETL